MFFEYSSSVRIRYQVFGSGTTTLLLIHGFGASLESWNDIEPLLRHSCTMWVLDLKGHGLSSKPEDDGYSIGEQALIVSAFIEKMGLKRLVLVGHSYGGGVALLTYLNLRQAPARIRRLILIDSAAYPQPLPFFVSMLRNPIAALIINLTPAKIQARYTLRRLFFSKRRVNEERIERYAKYLRLPGTHAALVRAAQNIFPSNAEDLAKEFETISVPTLITWGGNDPVIPSSLASRLHHDIRDSRLVVLPSCGHIPHEELPELTAGAIEQFITAGGEES